MKYEGKNILITGASSGIGKALVEELAAINCNIYILARRLNLLEEIKNSLANTKANIVPLQCDVSQKNEVKETYKKIIKDCNSIDLAILNSGVGIREKLEEYNAEAGEITFGVNVMGLVYWVEALLPNFMAKKSGIIAGVSSLADNRGFSGSGLYCASKAAASIYLEGLRTELRPHGIKVITIKPGFVKTAMTDKNNFTMPLLMSPEKAAKIILKRIKKGKSIIQFPLPTVFGSKLVGLIPSKIYELIGNKFS